MFGFIKISFFAGLTILSSVNLLTVTPLRCIWMTDQECKLRHKIINVNNEASELYPCSIKKQVNAVGVVTISMIHMQKCLSIML